MRATEFINEAKFGSAADVPANASKLPKSHQSALKGAISMPMPSGIKLPAACSADKLKDLARKLPQMPTIFSLVMMDSFKKLKQGVSLLRGTPCAKGQIIGGALMDGTAIHTAQTRGPNHPDMGTQQAKTSLTAHCDDNSPRLPINLIYKRALF
jgi:hypothetical protein